jgi:hypothetical protein
VLVTDDHDAESLVRDLGVRGWRVVTAVEQDAAGRLATVRLVLAGDDVRGAVADLLFASSGIEPEIVETAEPIEVVPGFTAPVATAPYLIALKVLARDDRTRPQDRLDLAALLQRADATTLEQARQALVLVARRGFDRGRALLSALDSAIAELGR